MKSKLKSLISIFILLLLPCCGPRYHKRILKPVHKRAAHFQDIHDDIKVRVRTLNENEANKMFDGRGTYLFTKDSKTTLVPVHILIKNHRDQSVTLSNKSINLPLVDYQRVVRRLQSNTVKRVFAISVVGLVCTTLVLTGAGIIGLFGAMSGLPIAIGASYAGMALSGVFLISTPVGGYLDGSNSYKANNILHQDIKEKTIANQLIIPPNGEQSVVVFVTQRNLKDQFTLQLALNQTSELITFNVDLEQNKK
jgi:hypothetical protein